MLKRLVLVCLIWISASCGKQGPYFCGDPELECASDEVCINFNSFVDGVYVEGACTSKDFCSNPNPEVLETYGETMMSATQNICEPGAMRCTGEVSFQSCVKGGFGPFNECHYWESETSDPTNRDQECERNFGCFERNGVSECVAVCSQNSECMAPQLCQLQRGNQLMICNEPHQGPDASSLCVITAHQVTIINRDIDWDFLSNPDPKLYIGFSDGQQWSTSEISGANTAVWNESLVGVPFPLITTMRVKVYDIDDDAVSNIENKDDLMGEWGPHKGAWFIGDTLSELFTLSNGKIELVMAVNCGQ
jgi:hypothetical protein